MIQHRWHRYTGIEVEGESKEQYTCAHPCSAVVDSQLFIGTGKTGDAFLKARGRLRRSASVLTDFDILTGLSDWFIPKSAMSRRSRRRVNKDY